MSEYNIKFQWDGDAAVWIATSEDVPGLVLESGSLGALMERVKITVPELLELNGVPNQALSLCFKSEKYEQVSL